MARTEAEIQQTIIDAKNAEPTLSVINSISKLAVFIAIRNVVVKAMLILESLWDIKKAELEAIAAAAVMYSEEWYADKSLSFQYGHALLRKDRGVLYYPVDDAAARIITKVAVITAVKGGIIIKVAKGSVGSLSPLTNAELVSFHSYINAIKQPGMQTQIISTPADLVKITGLTIFYDGKLNFAAFKTSVETAINLYLNNIYFGGQFSKNKLCDAIQAVPGVIEPNLTGVEIKDNGGSYTAVSLLHTFASGYGVIDPAFPISAQINYVAV